MIIQFVPLGSGSDGNIRCGGFHHGERRATAHAQTLRQSRRLRYLDCNEKHRGVPKTCSYSKTRLIF